jgi:hypothetical protein
VEVEQHMMEHTHLLEEEMVELSTQTEYSLGMELQEADKVVEVEHHQVVGQEELLDQVEQDRLQIQERRQLEELVLQMLEVEELDIMVVEVEVTTMA